MKYKCRELLPNLVAPLDWKKKGDLDVSVLTTYVRNLIDPAPEMDGAVCCAETTEARGLEFTGAT